MTTEITRRDALKQVGAVSVVGGVSVPVFAGGVSATESGEAELTLNGTIPDTTQIDTSIDEYDTESSDTPIATQTKTHSTGGETLQYANLDAQPDYYYEFTLDWSGDGSETPELDSLVFEVPLDFVNVDYTDQLEWEAKEENTIIEFDEQYLYEYQPKLRMSPEVRESQKGLYGYVARSADRDTDVLCYWSQLTHQDGLPGARADSHLGDHEPIYVFVNSESGDVEEIVYSAYHWFTGTAEIGDTPSASLATIRADKPTHATMTVVDPWHHYRFTPGEAAAFVELKSWPEVRETWIRNGFYDPADVATIEDPWSIRDSDGWWKKNSVDGRLAGVWARIGDILGWYGADKADDWGQ